MRPIPAQHRVIRIIPVAVLGVMDRRLRTCIPIDIMGTILLHERIRYLIMRRRDPLKIVRRTDIIIITVITRPITTVRILLSIIITHNNLDYATETK
jgi:hypothetical protein